MKEFDKLRALANDDSLSKDVAASDGGNRAAATRVRKVMQQIKETAQAIRVAALTEHAKGNVEDVVRDVAREIEGPKDDAAEKMEDEA
jgi:hypothetical protein